MSTSIFTIEASPQYPVNLVIDNHSVKVSDVIEPFMMDRITYIPIDFLVSEFSVQTTNHDDGVTITTYDAASNKIEIRLTNGSKEFTINNVPYTAEVAPVVISSRYCIPTRTLAPLFNMNVNYNDETNTLSLNKNCFNNRLYQ